MAEEQDAQGGGGAPLSMQEMFDRAYRGLRAQGFRQSRGSGCRYAMPDGRRCAWGHVDPSLGIEESRNLYELALNRVGVATQFHSDPFVAVGDSGYLLARALIGAHDYAETEEEMDRRLVAVAQLYGLTVPGEDADATPPV